MTSDYISAITTAADSKNNCFSTTTTAIATTTTATATATSSGYD